MDRHVGMTLNLDDLELGQYIEILKCTLNQENDYIGPMNIGPMILRIIMLGLQNFPENGK